MNNLRHYYLYAKHHYVRNEHIMFDLKKIHSRWCGMGYEYVTKEMILVKLLELTFHHIKNDTHFIDFVNDLLPGNRWKYGTGVQDELELVTVRNCLSILALTSLDTIPFEIGLGDKTLLPITKTAIEMFDYENNV